MTPEEFRESAWGRLATYGVPADVIRALLADADEYAAQMAERIARPPVAASLLDNPVVRWAD